MIGPKVAVFRSEKYRRYIASQACFGCGIEGHSQCAHANKGRGLGQKSSDADAFPLCSVRPGHMGCHQVHDLLIDMTLEDRRSLEDKYIARMQRIAAAGGWKLLGMALAA